MHVPIKDEIIDGETDLFILKEDEKANNLLREATTMHEILAKKLWQYKIRKKSTISDTDSDSKTNSMMK